MMKRAWIGLLAICLVLNSHSRLFAADADANGLFARKNLVAWCIVPFDSKKRGPEERAAMLEKLGFTQFAYDYRAEHIPTFDAELDALKRHHIELSAWWFPTVFNDEAKMTLAVFKKHHVTPQLWVTGGGEPTKSEPEQQQRVKAEAARIRPIAEAAAAVGCKVALYNHGGWFGEPENQIAIIQELKLPNVGIVYNLHHGHDHLERFPELLKKMQPYLLTLNLNGMVKAGDRQGQKILQLGQGDFDLALLKTIKSSGFEGPIGILGHTDDDAEERLHDNLDGLDWLLPQLQGVAAGPKPKMRTPVPAGQNAAAVQPRANLTHVVDGKFGKALDGKAGGAYIAGRDDFHQFPLTIECWTKLTESAPYNILVSNELKSSGTHWELFSMAGSGRLTSYTPGFAPEHCHTTTPICDGKWHHVAMILEVDRVRLYADGHLVADQKHQRTEMKTINGNLAIASLVDQQIGCTGLVDEVRISRGIRPPTAVMEKVYTVDESTLGLWHLDELVNQKQFDDALKLSPALISMNVTSADASAGRPKIEGHWGEDALGFRWTEADSRDDRLGQMDTGPFFSGSITGAGGTVYKGVVVRVGENRTASICYDTELIRASAGWTGFLKFDPARFGIIVPPQVAGDVAFTTPRLGGWTRTDEFSKFRESSEYGGLPKEEAHYEGLYRHANRVTLKFAIGSITSGLPTEILESPWLEENHGASALSRTIQVGPSSTPLSLLVAEAGARIRLIADHEVASLRPGPANSQIVVVPAHAKPITFKLLFAAAGANDAAFNRLASESPKPEDLSQLLKPGSTIWGEPLVTQGEVSSSPAALTIDTITLPFENRFKALMFCGGHDFLPDGRAFVCTLHGDVWLVDGIDDTLQKITWRRFATGLFQPLGVKLVPRQNSDRSTSKQFDLYVVGRDQISRLHDINGDGEADFYENFNNDAYVSLNGHEYVTCLETDRAGNFYYIKGNCNSATPHDGSLLQVSPDGTKLSVYATGFRNSNGIGIGPNDEITVAPQEGEWTPASAVFAVRQGGFYGGMMSHHKPTPPTDFEHPFCWFPRLADNSGGGQVWVPANHWGPLGGQLLHLSYGQCKLMILAREPLPYDLEPDGTVTSRLALHRSPQITMNGVTTDLPLSFGSGIHRGRFNHHDGHLYLTGLKGWVTSAVNDGCFQRVRYQNQPVDALIAMKTYRNGIALTFSRPLKAEDVTDIDNYQLEAWNIHWSAEYGSPDLKPSAPGQVGRDPVEPKSVTLLDDHRTVFLELPDLKPVDQMGITYSFHSADGAPLEQTAYLTLNGVSDETMPEEKLHRSRQDIERAELLSRLAPGIRVTAPFLKSTLQRRMVAWSDLTPNQPNQVIQAEGYLKVPATGDYRFLASVAGHAELRLLGKTYPLGDQAVTVRLRKGMTPIAIQHSCSTSQPHFRLMWESDRFPRESIPATLLFHERTTEETPRVIATAASGELLFARLKCAQCHLDSASASAFVQTAADVERLRQAPSLIGIGTRVTPEWLAAWLRNPGHVRPGATMPALIAEHDDAAVADLVAYLSSLRTTERSNESSPAAPSDSNSAVLTGEQRFERLGCIACHTFTPAEDNPDWHRMSLQFINHKYQPGQLEQFLRAPQQHHVGGHMPNFHLTSEESQSLAAHLTATAKGVIETIQPANPGDAERGKKRFAELRCDRCHQASETGQLATADVRSPFKGAGSMGCLSEASTSSGKIPHYSLTNAERDALLAYVKSPRDASKSDNKAGTATRSSELSTRDLFVSLRCVACHARDESSAAWPEIVAEEGSGKMPETVPQLTWVGEKLQGPWIAAQIKGELRQKTRPWIKARMPSFPVYADLIAHAMASEHGVDFAEPVPTNLDPDRIETGRRLTLRDGGLDCRQCHGVGKERPQGDVATQIALGINFAMTHERVRPEFVLRQLLDPPRYDVGSRMPRFAPDLKTTAARHIDQGDAKKQFEAIKQFLWSIQSED
ncbi:DUF6797 domain-containing protein [Schlesneria paludicola]|uniref:DUF6797 domain-containing protein n=1 Tax=Schlesneria paludicola TaxID=360056 RepID=UPI000299E645|nr:DUF6797 domain-containing protein [Schlesneria paludicola]